MIEPVLIFGSITVPCLGIALVYFYSCCVKGRVNQLEERVGLLENRPQVGATVPQVPQIPQGGMPVVVRVPYTPPSYQYAPYPPFQQVPPKPSAPFASPAGPHYI
jgi:hypothetical protein